MGKVVVFSSLLAFAAAGASFAADNANAQEAQTEERVVVVEQEEQAQDGQEQAQVQEQAEQEQAQNEQKETPPYQAAASKLMDKSVQDSQGEQLGSVEDLLLDEQNQISHVVVSSGGFLGLGGRNVALPIDQIEMQEDAVVYNGDKQQFSDLPEFAYQEDAQEQAVGGGQAGGEETETVTTEGDNETETVEVEQESETQAAVGEEKAQ